MSRECLSLSKTQSISGNQNNSILTYLTMFSKLSILVDKQAQSPNSCQNSFLSFLRPKLPRVPISAFVTIQQRTLEPAWPQSGQANISTGETDQPASGHLGTRLAWGQADCQHFTSSVGCSIEYNVLIKIYHVQQNLCHCNL